MTMHPAEHPLHRATPFVGRRNAGERGTPAPPHPAPRRISRALTMEAHRRTLAPEAIAPNGPDSNDDACECARRLLLPRTNAVSFSRRAA